MRRTRRAGFTLIELLIVVVIVGVLAAIAIPKFADTKGRAYVAAMKSDLRNLATSEEAYFFSFNRYSSSLAALNIVPSVQVTMTITEAGPQGWSATTAHIQTPVKCAMYVASAAPVAPATQEGMIACQ